MRSEPGGSTTWEAYCQGLEEMGPLCPNLVVVDASRSSVPDRGFVALCPDRFFPAGVSEQDLVLTAAGLALGGKTVFASSCAPFLVGRAYDQIRSAVAIPDLPVCLVTTRGGVTAGQDGADHQMVEDLAVMRVLPHMSVLVPADGTSTRGLVRRLSRLEGPAYLRLGLCPLPSLYGPQDGEFHPGGARLLTQGDGVTLCACGIMVHEALKAARILQRQGIEAEVIDCYSVKPLPEQTILASVRRTGCCVVAEEHSRIGGLGSAVAECLGREYPVPLRFVAVEDRFGQSGMPEELQEYYGLTFRQIVGGAVQVWAMRRR